MVDELAALRGRASRPWWRCASADGAALRYLAHRGLPGARRMRPSASTQRARGAGHARAQLVQLASIDGAEHGSSTVPLLAGERRSACWASTSARPAARRLGRGAALGGGRPTGAGPARHAAGDGTARLRRELRLTRRQRDVVFALVEHGASNEQIAEELGLSARTVKIHLQAAYRQLGVRTPRRGHPADPHPACRLAGRRAGAAAKRRRAAMTPMR